MAFPKRNGVRAANAKRPKFSEPFALERLFPSGEYAGSGQPDKNLFYSDGSRKGKAFPLEELLFPFNLRLEYSYINLIVAFD